MSLNFDGNRLIDLAVTSWHRRSTIIVLLLVVFVSGACLFAKVDLKQFTIPEFFVVVAACLLVLLFWIHSSALPKAPHNYIGIAVALAAETKTQQKRLSADLVGALRRDLERGTDLSQFRLIEISGERAARIQNSDNARDIRRQTRCKFILWGTAKLREINGQQKHVLDLCIQVGHRRIPREVSKRFSHEMSETFPNKLHLDQQNDLMIMELTADWLDLVARYFIGISLALSGFTDAAETTFYDLYMNHRLRNAPLEPIRKIRSRLPLRLADIRAWRSGQAYEAWRQSRSDSDLEEMYRHSLSVREVLSGHYGAKLHLAIYYFVKNRDLDRAIAEIRKCRNERDATWKYSYAFLLAYSGNMKRARRMYRSAFANYTERQDVTIQTEEFMLWVLSLEPDKTQLHFCLGLVNWHAKNDLAQAVQDFTCFLNAGVAKQFPEECRLAASYVTTLQRQLSSSDE